MKAFCFIAAFGQLLLLVYGIFAVAVGMSAGLASPGEFLLALLLTVISGMSLCALVMAANRIREDV